MNGRGAFLIGPGEKVPFRPTPSLRPHAFQSFDVRPYWRVATCDEVDCREWANGWATVLNTTDPKQQGWAEFLRSGRHGRRFTESRTEQGWSSFAFPAGQPCFAAEHHRIQAQRPALFVRQVGDHRARIGQPRIYDRPDQWADDFHCTTDRLVGARSRAGTADG